MVNSAGGDHQPLESPLFGERREPGHHPGPLGPDGVDGGKPAFHPFLVERVLRKCPEAPAEVGIENLGRFPGTGISGHGAQGKDLHEGTPFGNRIGIGDGARYVTPEKENASYPLGGQKFCLNAAPGEAPDRIMKNLAAFPVQVGILMAENKGVLLLGYRKDAGKESHVPLLDVNAFTKRLHHTPAGKFLYPVTEHEKVGKLARQCRSLEVGVKKPVHAV